MSNNDVRIDSLKNEDIELTDTICYIVNCWISMNLEKLSQKHGSLSLRSSTREHHALIWGSGTFAIFNEILYQAKAEF